MSHSPLRTETNCLNCGAEVTVRFCPVCGQENIIPKQTVFGLVSHFISDIFHFDGKFFYTVQQLLFRPGFIPKEYIAGKRLRFLDPIRMYLFTSAVFFLIFFSFKNNTDELIKLSSSGRSITRMERLSLAAGLHQQERMGKLDSVGKKQFNYLLDTTLRISIMDAAKPDNDSSFLIKMGSKEYLMQVVEPEPQKKEDDEVNWLNRKLQEKIIEYKTKFGDDEQAMASNIGNSFVHKFPYLLFTSLPFFAAILKLLYIRRRQFYYTDHAVFTLYQYIVTFLLLLLYFSFSWLNNWLDWSFFKVVSNLTVLAGGPYLLLAMKRFYDQGWLKTVGKFFVLNIFAFALLMLLMVIFIYFSVFQI